MSAAGIFWLIAAAGRGLAALEGTVRLTVFPTLVSQDQPGQGSVTATTVAVDRRQSLLLSVNVRARAYSASMRHLMLMWADADAAGGDQSDMRAWVDFDEQVKAANAFVLNGALAPAASEARLVQTAIAGHPLVDGVERRPFAEGERQIQAFYVMECDSMDAPLEWANKLPTYGYVEVRELLHY